MAHRKQGGTVRSLRDSKPKYLGIKVNQNQEIRVGQVILTQRGTRYLKGTGVGMGRDHTLFALIDGRVVFTQKTKKQYNGQVHKRVVVNVT